MQMEFLLSGFFGTIVLCIHAYNLFYSPNLKSVLGKKSYQILKGVEIDKLSSVRVQNRGLFFYIGIYLIAFAAILSVWELSVIVSDAGASSGKEGQSGPQGIVPTLRSQENVLSGEGDGRPLLIALGMLAMMSSTGGTGQRLRVVEGWIRNMAYRAAGIPHGIYRLITRLNKIDYHQAANEDASPLKEKLKKSLDFMDAQDRESLSTKKRVVDLEKDLLAIDVLRPAVHGTYEVFPAEAADSLSQLVEKQKTTWDNKLDQALDAVGANGDKVESKQLDELFKLTSDCLRNLKALFAVLYRQSNPREISDIHPPTTFIVNQLNMPDRHRLKDNAIISIILSVMVFIFCFPVLDAWQTMVEDPGKYASVFEVINTNAGIWSRTLQFVLKFFMLFLVTSLVVVAARRASIDDEREVDEYKLPMLPLSRLLPACFLPAVLGAVAAVGAMIFHDLISAMLQGDWRLSKQLVAGVILFQGTDLPLNFLLAGVVSLAIMVIADQHVNLSAWKTVTLASFFVVPFMMIAVFYNLVRNSLSGVQDLFTSAFFPSMQMALFAWAMLVLFALLVEHMEKSEEV